MWKGKVDGTQQRASIAAAPSCSPDTDCVELIWENGQIMMQGQSNKARKPSLTNNFQALGPKPQDIRNSNGSRMTKFGMMDSELADFSLPVPSCDMGLDQDVDMVPWMNYAVEDHLHHEYTTDYLRELSVVTVNNLSSENNLVSREKKSSILGNAHTSGVDSSASLQLGNTIKAPSSAEKLSKGGSSEVPEFLMPFQHNVPTSGISGITGNNISCGHQVTSRESIHNPSSMCTFTSSRLQKVDGGQPSTSSGYTNFPYFSRPTALARGNHLAVNSASRLGNDDKRGTFSFSNPTQSTLVNLSSGRSHKEIFSQNQSVLGLANRNMDLVPAKPAEEVLSSNQAMSLKDGAKNDELQNQDHGSTLKKSGMADATAEPVVAASSVCSGNSVERASNEPVHDLKRKSRENGESEGPSEEVEDESEGVRKAPPRTGAKRSRAAEVHNLSERRRRDRINEKMRALQELIPNCNKVDKASMLDEAIEYLKTLQLQVQMLSMGGGLYMQPMMLPPGMQPIQGAHMAQFSPMGVGIGMGLGLGYGMNMLDMNIGMKMMPFQGHPYPVPSGPAFHGMPGSGIQAFGHPGQSLPMPPMQRAPVHPVSGVAPPKMPIAHDIQSLAASTDVSALSPSSTSKVVGPQVLHNNIANSSINQTAVQPSHEVIGCPLSHDQAQADTTPQAAVAASGTDATPR